MRCRMACGRRAALSRGGAIRALAPAMRANARIRLRGAPIARTGNTARFYFMLHDAERNSMLI